MTKYLLYVTSAQVTTQNTLYIIWCLLNVNNICDLLRIAWSTTKWAIHHMLSFNISSIFFTGKWPLRLPTHPIKKGDVEGKDWESYPTTLIKLPQNWVICTGKGGHQQLCSSYHNIGLFVSETFKINEKC